MDHIFKMGHGFQVPDGTWVYGFLNPKDPQSGLPWNLVEGFNMSGGEIAPHSHSKIHLHPLVTQVTYVICGNLDVKMKDPTAPEPYLLHLHPEQAIITCPGTFLQLINPAGVTCRVFYLVSPPYVFEMDADQIIYDDALVLDESWQDLENLGWKPPALLEHQKTPEARAAALKRLETRIKH